VAAGARRKLLPSAQFLDDPGLEEDEILGDVRHTISDALEVVGDQHELGRCVSQLGVPGDELDELVEDTVVRTVDVVVPGSDEPSLLDATGDHSREHVAHLGGAGPSDAREV